MQGRASSRDRAQEIAHRTALALEARGYPAALVSFPRAAGEVGPQGIALLLTSVAGIPHLVQCLAAERINSRSLRRRLDLFAGVGFRLITGSSEGRILAALGLVLED